MFHMCKAHVCAHMLVHLNTAHDSVVCGSESRAELTQLHHIFLQRGQKISQT